ncbi:MAG: nucleotidyltransferase family protein [Myxococcota bacterium]
MLSLLDTFRVLASFDPPRIDLSCAPWEVYVDWAIAQGLAPLAAYNLEYRLGGAGAPTWAKDRLLSVYQGTLNDNVMKLVNFKRAIDELEGAKVILLGGASFAEALYPHIAFRPVLDLELLLADVDVPRVVTLLEKSDFRRTGPSVLSDGRTEIRLFTSLLPPEVFLRVLPMKVFGPNVFRLDLEDALLALCLFHARQGYEVPMLSFVDLRELLLGAPSLGGPYSRPPDVAKLHARVKVWRLERALHASLAIAERLFEGLPDAKPSLRAPTRALLNRMVVGPACELGKMHTVRGSDRLRRLLTGGR